MIPKIIHFVWLGGGKYPPPGSGLHKLLEEDHAGLYHKALG